jgi:hypothetical protein
VIGPHADAHTSAHFFMYQYKVGVKFSLRESGYQVTVQCCAGHAAIHSLMHSSFFAAVHCYIMKQLFGTTTRT